MYEIQDENGSPLFQAALYLKNKDAEHGTIIVYVLTLKVGAPLPDSLSSAEYLKILSTLEEKGFLECLELGKAGLPEAYLILPEPESDTLSSSSDDPGFDEEISNWLEKYLVDSEFLNKITSMIKSIRNKSASSKENIVPDPKGEIH